MKRAIVANADGRFISGIVPKGTAPALTEGTRVRAMQELDLRPYATVPVGAEGTVTFVDFDTGVVEITLDEHHKDLWAWRNMILITPFECDDLLHGLAFLPPSVQRTNVA